MAALYERAEEHPRIRPGGAEGARRVESVKPRDSRGRSSAVRSTTLPRTEVLTREASDPANGCDTCQRWTAKFCPPTSGRGHERRLRPRSRDVCFSSDSGVKADTLQPQLRAQTRNKRPTQKPCSGKISADCREPFPIVAQNAACSLI